MLSMVFLLITKHVVVQQKQNERNFNRIRKGKLPIKSYQCIFNLEEQPNRYHKLKTGNVALKNFYCYVFQQDFWRAYLYSSQPHSGLSLESCQYIQKDYSYQENTRKPLNEFGIDDMVPLKQGLIIKK